MNYNDPNENYTGILIKDTYQNVMHIGGSGSYSGSLFNGVGDLVNIPWTNLSQSVLANIGSGSSANSVKFETFTLIQDDIDNKFVELALNPKLPYIENVFLYIQGAGNQYYGDDFVQIGNVTSWDTLGIDTILSVGDKITIQYCSM